VTPATPDIAVRHSALIGMLLMLSACGADAVKPPPSKPPYPLAGSYFLTTALTSFDSTINNCTSDGATCIHSQPAFGAGFGGTLIIPGDTIMGVDAAHFRYISIQSTGRFCIVDTCISRSDTYIVAFGAIEQLPGVKPDGAFRGDFARMSCNCSVAQLILTGTVAGDSISGTVLWFPANQNWNYSGTFVATRLP
jgi:hypothetical protein